MPESRQRCLSGLSLVVPRNIMETRTTPVRRRPIAGQSQAFPEWSGPYCLSAKSQKKVCPAVGVFETTRTYYVRMLGIYLISYLATTDDSPSFFFVASRAQNPSTFRHSCFFE